MAQELNKGLLNNTFNQSSMKGNLIDTQGAIHRYRELLFLSQGTAVVLKTAGIINSHCCWLPAIIGI